MSNPLSAPVPLNYTPAASSGSSTSSSLKKGLEALSSAVAPSNAPLKERVDLAARFIASEFGYNTDKMDDDFLPPTSPRPNLQPPPTPRPNRSRSALSESGFSTARALRSPSTKRSFGHLSSPAASSPSSSNELTASQRACLTKTVDTAARALAADFRFEIDDRDDEIPPASSYHSTPQPPPTPQRPNRSRNPLSESSFKMARVNGPNRFSAPPPSPAAASSDGASSASPISMLSSPSAISNPNSPPRFQTPMSSRASSLDSDRLSLGSIRSRFSSFGSSSPTPSTLSPMLSATSPFTLMGLSAPKTPKNMAFLEGFNQLEAGLFKLQEGVSLPVTRVEGAKGSYQQAYTLIAIKKPFTLDGKVFTPAPAVEGPIVLKPECKPEKKPTLLEPQTFTFVADPKLEPIHVQLLIKAHHGENTGWNFNTLEQHMKNALANYENAKRFNLPVSEIFNAKSALQQKALVVEYLPDTIDYRNGEHLAQVRTFFNTMIQNEVPFDATPENFRIKKTFVTDSEGNTTIQETVTLIDFMERANPLNFYSDINQALGQWIEKWHIAGYSTAEIEANYKYLIADFADLNPVAALCINPERLGISSLHQELIEKHACAAAFSHA